MQIHGFQKTTLLDYPEHLAATVFTGGCNFRCPFCHNAELVLCPGEAPTIPEQDVIDYLEKRRGILQGVCITGGEPTLQKDLRPFIQKIKSMGYLVKLDTNGYRPAVLWNLLQEGLLNYVAMDVKASKDNYAAAAGIPGLDVSAIEESIAILMNCEIDYEFRTTVVRGIHTVEEFVSIGKWLSGCKAYFLQQFRESDNIIGEGMGAFSLEEMQKMQKLCEPYIQKVILRGVS